MSSITTASRIGCPYDDIDDHVLAAKMADLTVGGRRTVQMADLIERRMSRARAYTNINARPVVYGSGLSNGNGIDDCCEFIAKVVVPAMIEATAEVDAEECDDEKCADDAAGTIIDYVGECGPRSCASCDDDSDSCTSVDSDDDRRRAEAVAAWFAPEDDDADTDIGYVGECGPRSCASCDDFANDESTYLFAPLYPKPDKQNSA